MQLYHINDSSAAQRQHMLYGFIDKYPYCLNLWRQCLLHHQRLFIGYESLRWCKDKPYIFRQIFIHNLYIF